jgi:hypothetical protein
MSSAFYADLFSRSALPLVAAGGCFSSPPSPSGIGAALIGTTAAMSFLCRVNTTTSFPKQTRFRISANRARASVAGIRMADRIVRYAQKIYI